MIVEYRKVQRCWKLQIFNMSSFNLSTFRLFARFCAVDHFHLRWNGNFLRNECCIHQRLFKYFFSEGHYGFLNEVDITVIHETDSKDPDWRQHYWRHTLKSYGVRKPEDDWICFCKFFKLLFPIFYGLWPLVLWYCNYLTVCYVLSSIVTINEKILDNDSCRTRF